MARSYARRKAVRKGGTLVRENPVTRAVSVNSLYPIPVRIKVNSTSPITVLKTDSNFANNKTIAFYEATSGDPEKTLANVVRVSSIDLKSKSPFTVTVVNALGAGKWTTYQCVGQKINKIIPSRETSIIGNAALLAKYQNSGSLMSITDAEDQVDITFHCVVDGDLD